MWFPKFWAVAASQELISCLPFLGVMEILFPRCLHKPGYFASAHSPQMTLHFLECILFMSNIITSNLLHYGLFMKACKSDVILVAHIWWAKIDNSWFGSALPVILNQVLSFLEAQFNSRRLEIFLRHWGGLFKISCFVIYKWIKLDRIF